MQSYYLIVYALYAAPAAVWHFYNDVWEGHWEEGFRGILKNRPNAILINTIPISHELYEELSR